MGDITTHYELSRPVIRELRSVTGAGYIPDADYSYLQLGNFITDVAQFRDPVAFHDARAKARKEAKKAAGLLLPLAGDVDGWANGMFGRASLGPRHGALPEFL